jgi:hypothetical protein
VSGVFASLALLAGPPDLGLSIRDPEMAERLREAREKMQLDTNYTVLALTGVIRSLATLTLGAFGGGVIGYVHELRKKGKSQLGWTLPGGAIAGIVCILVSFLSLIALIFLSQSSIAFGLGLRLPFLVMGNVVPIGMILLFFNRNKLK